MDIEEDRWLSAVFGHEVFRIDIDSSADPQQTQSVCGQIGRHAGSKSAAMYYAKIDVRRTDLVRHLGLVGLCVVDVNVTLEMKPVADPFGERSESSTRIQIHEARADEHERIVQVAGDCFEYSRFHSDPLVPRSLANRIKSEWIRNYVAGKRGDRLLVATVDGVPAGFLAALTTASGSWQVGVIDLIGVDRSCQGRGIGASLVAEFQRRYSKTCNLLQVGTQIANVPSMRVYQKCGFLIHQARYVLHLHVRDGETMVR